MKKIVAIIVLLSGLFLLASCNKGPQITVELTNSTASELELSVKVGNKRKVESGTVNLYLYTNYGETNQKQVNARGVYKYEDTLTFTGLEADTAYDVRVTCTYDEETGYEAFLGEFKTLPVTDVAISNVESFKGISSNISETSSYVLGSDIDFADTEYETIGSKSEFAGVFDGKGYSLNNIKITKGDGNVGLFGKVTGTVKNLVIKNMTIEITATTGTWNVGAVAGHCSGTIENVTIENLTIKFTNGRSTSSYNTAVGSLVGRQEAIKPSPTKQSKIEGCVIKNSIFEITAKNTTVRAGGLIGLVDKEGQQCELEISNVYVDSRITATNRYSSKIGGAIGELDVANINNVYAKSDITLKNEYTSNSYDLQIGGFAGISAGSNIENVVVDSNISLTTNAKNAPVKIGAYAGKSKDNVKITGCLFDLNVTLEAKSFENDDRTGIGKLIGHTDLDLDPTVTKSYSNAVAKVNEVDYVFLNPGENTDDNTEDKFTPFDSLHAEGYVLSDEFAISLNFDMTKWQGVDGKLVYKA